MFLVQFNAWCLCVVYYILVMLPPAVHQCYGRGKKSNVNKINTWENKYNRFLPCNEKCFCFVFYFCPTTKNKNQEGSIFTSGNYYRFVRRHFKNTRQEGNTSTCICKVFSFVCKHLQQTAILAAL